MPSIVDQTPFNEYVGNGVSTVYAYEFQLLSANDLVVKVAGVVVPASDYTLAGVGVQSGGTVTFDIAPANGAAVLLSREITPERAVDYQTNGDLFAEVLDLDLNRLWQALQGVVAIIGGALRAPYPEQVSELPSAALRANTLLGFNALGDYAPYPVDLEASGAFTGGAAYPSGTVGAAIRERGLSIHDAPFNAVGNGVVDDTAAFAAAAATGRRVLLRDGATYLLSSRVSLGTGSGFVCRDGTATVVFKTGAGGFNSTDLTADKNATTRCGFLADTVDDVEISGVRLLPDGVNPVVIYPIRVRGGMTVKGARFSRLLFENFPICNGGLLAMGSVGAGSYNVRDITARNCGTSSTAWTGTPQITVVEIDNDMVASTPSVHGFITDIRGIDLAFTGAALTAYGQQTDVVNIAGISGTDRKGPTITGVYGENVGEIVDLYCSHAIVRGVRGRNVYSFGVKLVHGAQWNHLEIETIENFGIAAVVIAGSASVAVDTQFNTVKVGAVRVNADIAGAGTVAAVLFQANGGTEPTCLPRKNFIRVDVVSGDGVNLDYVVRDGAADTDNDNVVEVGYATGWATVFASAPPDNVRVRYRQNPRAAMTVGAAQTLTTNTWTRLQFNTLAVDTDGGANTGTYGITPRFPGPKLVRGSMRVSGINAGDDVEMRILLNGAVVAQSGMEPQSGGLAYGFTIDKVVYVAENVAGTASAELAIEARIVSAGTISVNNVATMSYFEVTDLG